MPMKQNLPNKKWGLTASLTQKCINLMTLAKFWYPHCNGELYYLVQWCYKSTV